MALYKCQKCKKECSVIRLTDDKIWICDKCAFPQRKK